MYLAGELREKALREIKWLAHALEQDLETSDWAPSAFAARIRERALETALIIEGFAESPKQEGEEKELTSFYTHKGRIHARFPLDWLTQPALFAYEDDPQKGAVAMIYFPAAERAFRLYEDWSGSQAGFVQPTPVVEVINPKEVAWERQPPKIFEPLSKVRLYGGSSEPILLEAVA